MIEFCINKIVFAHKGSFVFNLHFLFSKLIAHTIWNRNTQYIFIYSNNWLHYLINFLKDFDKVRLLLMAHLIDLLYNCCNCMIYITIIVIIYYMNLVILYQFSWYNIFKYFWIVLIRREENQKSKKNRICKVCIEIVQYYCCYYWCGLILRPFHYLTKKKPTYK